jgi:hypothetical protein
MSYLRQGMFLLLAQAVFILPLHIVGMELHHSELLDTAIVSEYVGEEIGILGMDLALCWSQLIHLDTVNGCAYGAP